MISFGISSIIISVVAIFIPVFGVMVSGIAGVLAWLSAGRGTTLGAAAVIINFLNIFFLSPAYIIAVGLEASSRTAEEQKLFSIWLIVLFIQIAAIVVFIVNICIDKWPIFSFKLEKQTRTATAKQKDTLDDSPPLGKIDIDSDESVSKITKVLIHKVHGGRKKDSKFWNTDIDLSKNKENNFDISIDSTNKKKRKKAQKPWMLPSALTLVIIVILIIARPDLFPFLDYHKIYNSFDGRSGAIGINNLEEEKHIKKDLRHFPQPTRSPQKQRQPISARWASEKEQIDYAKRHFQNAETIYCWEDSKGNLNFSNTGYPSSGEFIPKWIKSF